MQNREIMEKVEETILRVETMLQWGREGGKISGYKYTP